MSEQPQFNIEDIINHFQNSPLNASDSASINSLIENTDFTNSADTIALIGTGGTLSSAYSPRKETILPGKYAAASQILDNINNTFGIVDYKYTSIDLFAKDSRDVTNDDLIFLINFIDSIKNERILIVTGTYMLPKIAYLLIKILQRTNKIIGLTGAMLPLGFLNSDAPANVMSTISLINERQSNNHDHNIFVAFHGMVFDEPDKLDTIDFHPSEFDDSVILYPKTTLLPSKKSQ